MAKSNIGQLDNDPKAIQFLTKHAAQQKQRSEVLAKLGVYRPEVVREKLNALIQQVGQAVPGGARPRFAGAMAFAGAAEDIGSATDLLVEGGNAIAEGARKLQELGVPLPEEAIEAVDTAAKLTECALKIGAGAASGAATGIQIGGSISAGLSGLDLGITAAAVTEVAAIAGAIIAAIECGLFTMIWDFFGDAVDFIAELFNPTPPNFQLYFDVAGPALRPTNWTPNDKYDLEKLLGTMGLTGEGRAAILGLPTTQQKRKELLTRLPGSRVSTLQRFWLLRRIRELGGGSEEYALLSRVTGVKSPKTGKSTALYDKLVAAIEQGSPQMKNLMKPVLVNWLIAGGFNRVEAETKVYGKTSKGLVKARLELGTLRALLASFLPTKREIDERIAIAKAMFKGDPLAGIGKPKKLDSASLRSAQLDPGKLRSGSASSSGGGMGAIGLVAIAGAAFLLLRRK